MISVMITAKELKNALVVKSDVYYSVLTDIKWMTMDASYADANN
jgi:hypothetical protein